MLFGGQILPQTSPKSLVIALLCLRFLTCLAQNFLLQIIITNYDRVLGIKSHSEKSSSDMVSMKSSGFYIKTPDWGGLYF